MSMSVPRPDLHRMFCQIYIAVEEVEDREFEILGMIPENTQLFDGKSVPSGPALRGADGEEHIKSAKEGKGGFFPPKVAEVGAFIKLQDAGVSRKRDKVSILNHIVQSDDPTREPPKEHAEYDRINCKVRGLFRGAAMWSYAMRGNTGKLRELLSAGTEEIEYQAPSGATPTIMAAQQGNTECLELLLQCKADLDKPNKKGTTPTYMAAQNGNTKCLQLLLQCKADLDKPHESGTTPTSMAAQKGNVECLQLLLQSKADPNKPNNKGVTPIGKGVSKCNVDVVQLLVALGVDVTPAPDNWGDTPLSEAKSKGHSSIVEILLAAGAK